MAEYSLNRRGFFKVGSVCLAGSTLPILSHSQSKLSERNKTEFQIACMTLPYSQFSFRRALQGIQNAGYQYVAWGTRHTTENGEKKPVLAEEASPRMARELGDQCRDQGLIPLMMFSMVYPENDKAIPILTHRIKQASAAGIPQVLTFGHTEGSNRNLWIKRFKRLGPVARDHGVLVVIKQHGGNTGTGAACAEIVREVGHSHIKVNYDAGNVMDYLNVDPIPDIKLCAEEVRSFCIKDHRNFPKDQDCGPGYGEIDHYKLLHPVAFSKLKIPLCCENIFVPILPRPINPNQIDKLARRAREYLEIVTQGLQA